MIATAVIIGILAAVWLVTQGLPVLLSIAAHAAIWPLAWFVTELRYDAFKRRQRRAS